MSQRWFLRSRSQLQRCPSIAIVGFGPQMRVGRAVDQLHIHPHLIVGLCTLPSRMLARRAAARFARKFSGELLYFCVEVREITFRSAILASRVRISSWMPSAKYALSGLRLRFSNGRTAMFFSGIFAGYRCAESRLAGRKNFARRPPPADADINKSTVAAIAHERFASRRFRFVLRRWRRSAPSVPMAGHAKQIHRHGNVLQFRRRQFFEARLQRVANLPFDIHRDANPACAGQRLDARGDVDSVAVNVAAAMHHVTDVNADL